MSLLDVNKSKFFVMELMDLFKAVDLQNHSIILSKLGHYGIEDEALQWFNSYF